jgi:hypothetical protein
MYTFVNSAFTVVVVEKRNRWKKRREKEILYRKFPFWERKEDTSHQEQKPIVPSLFFPSHYSLCCAVV